jgi:hypothetical protein
LLTDCRFACNVMNTLAASGTRHDDSMCLRVLDMLYVLPHHRLCL